jgi:hypothetical protein
MDGTFKRGKRLPDGTIHANYEYHARQLIRSIFAFIEAVTFSVKIGAAERCDTRGLGYSEAERLFVAETEFALKDNGEIFERPAHIRLADNIRFAFRLQEKSRGMTDAFNANVKWWACLKSSIKVRDRIMHPKMPEDVDISPDEIINALEAYKGFQAQLAIYGNYGESANNPPNRTRIRKR